MQQNDYKNKAYKGEGKKNKNAKTLIDSIYDDMRNLKKKLLILEKNYLEQ